MDNVKYLLPETDIPTAWYNIAADLPVPLPPVIHPGTMKPIGPQDLAPIFPMAVIEQEVSTDRWIQIPEPVRDIYRQWRCTPLHRARRLEQLLGTPAKIYFKNEGVSPAGSHKPNSAIPQAYYNKREGVKRIITETGAGQWGSSLALAGTFFDIEVLIYMVKVSYHQKPYRRALMETWGGKVIASPSDTTAAGRAILAKDPNCTGSLGMAIAEAVEVAAQDPNAKYALGSVLNHVALHQTIIGLEALKQLEAAGDYPDVVIACAGGGSNFAGIAFPFLGKKLRGERTTRVLAVEPASCPSLTKGKFTYDFGDTAHLTPLMKMYTLGNTFVPEGIHAGGLRYHGMSPIVSHLMSLGQIEARAYPQLGCFEAAMTFARAEGLLPAPESSHAIKGAIDEALRCKRENKAETILFNLSGHGYFDMPAYQDYRAGKLVDHEYSHEEVDSALADLPAVSGY